MSFVIARIENYKMGDIGGVGKEQEREKEYVEKHYKNPDYDPEKTKDNVTLYHDPGRDGKTWERYLKDFREENNIQGRFTTKGSDKSQTNVLTGFMVTASPEYMSSMSREEQIQFGRDAFEFMQKEFPSYHWVEVTIHFDEKNVHVHGLGIPLYHDKEKDRTIFSTTKTQPGKEYFRGFQDRLYEHMSERWFGLERGTRGSEREHLSVQDYKNKMNLEKERKDLQQEREELQREKESYRGPVPEKIPLLGTRYKAQDVAKVVELNKALYGENERLKGENKGLRNDLARANREVGRLDDTIRLYEQDRQETRERLQDPAFLREQLRSVEHGHGHGHEHTPMMPGPAGR